MDIKFEIDPRSVLYIAIAIICIKFSFVIIDKSYSKSEIVPQEQTAGLTMGWKIKANAKK